MALNNLPHPAYFFPIKNSDHCGILMTGIDDWMSVCFGFLGKFIMFKLKWMGHFFGPQNQLDFSVIGPNDRYLEMGKRVIKVTVWNFKTGHFWAQKYKNTKISENLFIWLSRNFREWLLGAQIFRNFGECLLGV